MKKKLDPFIRWILLALLLFSLLPGCSPRDADQEFFRGRTVTIIVPHGPGGMDTYARLIAPYLQKYLPGSNVEVVNVVGEGSITGRNQVYEAAPDGLTLGFTTAAGSLLTEWSGNEKVHYKTADFAYIGRLNAEPHVMVASPRSHITSLEDILRAGKLRMGFAGVGSDDYYVALASARLLGWTVEPHAQYTSVFDAGLACVQGEVDAILFSDSSVHQQIAAQTVLPILIYGEKRMESLPGVPTILESVPADKIELIRAVVQIYQLDRTLFAPPGISAGRLDVLRAALDQAVVDPEFLHSAKDVQRPVNYLTGLETEHILSTVLAGEAEIRPLVKEIAGGGQ